MKQIAGPVSIIKKSIDIFFKKENMLFFIKIYLPILPFAIFRLFQGNFFVPSTSEPKDATSTFVVVVFNLLFMLTYLWVTASGIEGSSRVVSGSNLDLALTFKVGWKKYFKFFLLGLSLFLIYVFGFILLIIPGLIFVVWFAFSRFIIIDQEVGIGEAIKKSKAMVNGLFFKVWGRLIVFGLFAALVQGILGLIPYAGSVLINLMGGFLMLPSYLLYRELRS